MTKAIVKFVDGDSGEMQTIDGTLKTTRVRLSGVRSPEKLESGFGISAMRAKNLVREDEVVDVKIVGKDSYGRSLIEIKKQGRDINAILEAANKLFRATPPKTKKRPRRTTEPKDRRTNRR